MKKSKFELKTEWWELVKDLSEQEQSVLFRNLFHHHLGQSKMIETPTDKVSVIWSLIKQSFASKKSVKKVIDSKKTINLAPFPSEFQQVWDDWIEYKRNQFKFTYKSDKYEQMAFNELLRISGRNYVVATTIVKQSISNGWRGFFPLKQVSEAVHTPY